MQTMIDQENTAYKRLACILILIGILLGIDSYFGRDIFLNFWPILVAILGVGFIGIFLNGKRKGYSYLIIGIYMILFTILALYCNFTTWKSLSTFWPIFITFLGISLIIIFIASKGHRFMLFAGVALIFISIYFFAVFSVTTQSWWTIFVFAGLCILLCRIKK